MYCCNGVAAMVVCICGAGAGAQLALTSNLSRWMLVPSSQVSLDGATCNMAGTGYAAFANQAVRLLLPFLSAMHPPINLYCLCYGALADQAACLALPLSSVLHCI